MQLEEAANEAKHDVGRQYEFLRELNKEAPEVVVQRVESGHYAVDALVHKEYVKGLVMSGKFEQRSAKQIEEVMSRFAGGARKEGGRGAATNMTSSSSQAHNGAVVAGGIGMESRPVHVVMQEPGAKQQVWRTIRMVIFAFFVFTGLNALISRAVEERGLGGPFGANNEVKAHAPDDSYSFKDVEGVDEAKEELREVVSFLKDPDQFKRLGGKLPKGVMMMGPPGTGKTLLARAIAGEAAVPFFYCSGSEFDEMYVGVGARRIRDLFATAKKRAPCIVFIDEIDAIGGSRNPMDQKYVRMTLNQLLVELDGFKTTDGIIVIGATNFPESLDKALVRPGRFDLHIQVPLPDVKGREKILQVHSTGMPLGDNVDLKTIARGTPGFSGADLSNLVNQAALKASMERKSEISMGDLEHSKDKILMGVERRSAIIPEKNRRVTAYHEGGHALVAMLTQGANPIHKATIMPRGRALGMVMQLPVDDQLSLTKEQMLARMDVAMAGRVAEEQIFGDANVTTGASNDFEQATQMAHAMVTKYGMSPKVGPVAHSDESLEKLSTETRSVIESETKRLLTESYERAKTLVKKNEHLLERLASALLEHETLTAKDLKRVLAGEEPLADGS